jgi:hypothetical protein
MTTQAHYVDACIHTYIHVLLQCRYHVRTRHAHRYKNREHTKTTSSSSSTASPFRCLHSAHAGGDDGDAAQERGSDSIHNAGPRGT